MWARRLQLEGRNSVFEEQYLATRRIVFGRCLRMLKDRALAEDATHETFLRAYENLDHFRGSNFLAWVSSIAVNLCLNRLRSSQTRERFQHKIDRGRAPVPPDQMLETNRRAEQAREVLETLSSDQRKVLILKYLEGLSYDEISDFTGYDSERIRSLLQNGRRNFRIRWGQLGESAEDKP